MSGDRPWADALKEAGRLGDVADDVPPPPGRAAFPFPELLVVYIKGTNGVIQWGAGGASILCRIDGAGRLLEPPRCWAGSTQTAHDGQKLELYALAWVEEAAAETPDLPVLVRCGHGYAVPILSGEMDRRRASGWVNSSGKPMASAETWAEIDRWTQGRLNGARPLTDIPGDIWAERVTTAAKRQAEAARIEWMGGDES